jgi:hypothetical protein
MKAAGCFGSAQGSSWTRMAWSALWTHLPMNSIPAQDGWFYRLRKGAEEESTYNMFVKRELQRII